MKVEEKLEKQKQRILRQYRRSGLPISRFCLREGFSQSILRTILKQLPVDEVKSLGCFVPIRLVEMDGLLFPVVLG